VTNPKIPRRQIFVSLLIVIVNFECPARTFLYQMNGEIEQATQHCEDRRLDLLTTLVPKTVDANAMVFVFTFYFPLRSPWASYQAGLTSPHCSILRLG
jgi:hypothetical protein